jgi:hypothetical protein
LLVVFVVLASAFGTAVSATAGSNAGSNAGAGAHRPAFRAAAPVGDAAAARVPSYSSADLRSPASWRAARIRVLRDRLAAMRPTAGGTVVIASYLFDDALPIADVDGDGSADVLSVRVEARTPSVEVMSGRTGRVLWSHADPNAYAAIYLAAPGLPSTVLILSDSETGADAIVAGASEDVFTVGAFRADHGTQLWTTSIDGFFEYDVVSFRAVGIGELDGVLTRRAAAPYLLFDRGSEAGAFIADGTSIAPEVVDATTGAPVSAGPPIASDDFAFASPVDDLNGDGTDDYILSTSGDAAVIDALSGATGAPLWATALTSPGGAAFVNFVGASPDLSGDHAPDVLVGWFDGDADEVAARNGSSGAVVWTHVGDYASPLGDIDRDGRSDTRVVSFGPRTSYLAVTGTGRTAWSSAVASPRGDAMALSYPVGDLNGDGAVDTYLRFLPRPTSKEGPGTNALAPAVAAHIIDGRTGRVRSVHDLGTPTGDSLSGRAMAFVQTVNGKHGVRITAFNGATGLAYWHTTVSAADVTSALDVSVLRMSGGRRGIVELLNGRTSETVVVLDAQRGARRWTAGYPTQGGVIFFV